jgi:hypothetical protein
MGLLGDDALTFVVLDHVARFIPQALGFGEGLDQRFRFDSQQTLL